MFSFHQVRVRFMFTLSDALWSFYILIFVYWKIQVSKQQEEQHSVQCGSLVNTSCKEWHPVCAEAFDSVGQGRWHHECQACLVSLIVSQLNFTVSNLFISGHCHLQQYFLLQIQQKLQQQQQKHSVHFGVTPLQQWHPTSITGQRLVGKDSFWKKCKCPCNALVHFLSSSSVISPGNSTLVV